LLSRDEVFSRSEYQERSNIGEGSVEIPFQEGGKGKSLHGVRGKAGANIEEWIREVKQ
jgi:hypothetical protein